MLSRDYAAADVALNHLMDPLHVPPLMDLVYQKSINDNMTGPEEARQS